MFISNLYVRHIPDNKIEVAEDIVFQACSVCKVAICLNERTYWFNDYHVHPLLQCISSHCSCVDEYSSQKVCIVFGTVIDITSALKALFYDKMIDRSKKKKKEIEKRNPLVSCMSVVLYNL